MKAVLHIDSVYGKSRAEVNGELSIGRTDQAGLRLDDTGLSRVNTTFFIDDGQLWVADENSTNGTFLNGERIVGPARILQNGDRLKIGSGTTILVQIGTAEPVGSSVETGRSQTLRAADVAAVETPAAAVPSAEGDGETDMSKWLLIAAGGITFVILLFGAAAFFLLPGPSDQPTAGGQRPVTVDKGSPIPVRVMDPLGGENEDDLEDLIASWEAAETEIDAATVADVTVSSADAEEQELNVTAAFLAQQQRLALENRPGEKGIRPAGLDVPKELFGDGVIKQKAKLRMMNQQGYQQPMDFADLAEKRMKRTLIEMPMAAKGFYLDVGGSAKDDPFTAFSFASGNQPIQVGSPKYGILSALAANFAGQKYDLNNPADRKQMRMRLLRMFNPRAKDILHELGNAYQERFGRPLRVTSLTRSMDYQILLNQGNANSFKVRGEGSLPPHTSGCAFDLARKHMPVEEQNFLMKKLAEMENAGKLDALIEYGVNACFHIFIYDDGVPPKM